MLGFFFAYNIPMKTIIATVLTLISLSSFASDKDPSCPIQVEPGQSFGPLKLGMSRDEVAKLGLTQKEAQTSRINQVIGLYTVQFDGEDKVIDIGAELEKLPNCLYYGKRKIKPTATAKELAKIFKNCKKEEVRMGGNHTHCQALWIQTGGWGGKQKTPNLRVHSATYGMVIE
jgi:hypothetical protein